MQGVNVTLEELLSLRHLAYQICLPQPTSSRSDQQGNYQSPFRGRGMDFVENRVYQPGDDIRSINWAVTARTGKTHTKVYQQERERPVYLVVDLNLSMFFGTRTAFKSVSAANIAALLAWAALRNGDRIGSLLVKEASQLLPPFHSKRNLVEFLKNLVQFVMSEPSSYFGLAPALKKLHRSIKSGSLIFIISDFYNLDKNLEEQLQHLAKHHEVSNIFIYDPIEKNPPESDRYLFHDFIQQQSVLLDTFNRSVCTEYRTIFADRLLRLKKLSYGSGMNVLEIATNDDLAKMLRQVVMRKML